MSASPSIHPTLDRAVHTLVRAGLVSGRSGVATVSGPTDEVTVPMAPLAVATAHDLLAQAGFAEVPGGRGPSRLLATYDPETDRWLRLRLLPEPPHDRGLRAGEWLRRGLDRDRGPGMLVAIMGPDGAGKSTLSAGIASSFILPVSRHYAGLYPADRRRYPVPGLGLAALLLRLLRMRRAAAAQRRLGRIVVFDRYAYDALVPLPPGAPLKSRLRRRLLARSSPTPDLLVVLDAPLDVLRGRRGEHPAEIVEVHRRFYLGLAGSVPNAVVVDASADADAVRRTVTALIWRRYADRRPRRGH